MSSAVVVSKGSWEQALVVATIECLCYSLDVGECQ
jgi:hypothetical protein